MQIWVLPPLHHSGHNIYVHTYVRTYVFIFPIPIRFHHIFLSPHNVVHYRWRPSGPFASASTEYIIKHKTDEIHIELSDATSSNALGLGVVRLEDYYTSHFVCYDWIMEGDDVPMDVTLIRESICPSGKSRMRHFVNVSNWWFWFSTTEWRRLAGEGICI